MPRLQNIPLSCFPADVLSVLLLPATVVFFVVASSLPRFWRALAFALIGLAFIRFAIRFARSGRVLDLVWAALYLLFGLGTFYVAYVEAILFA